MIKKFIKVSSDHGVDVYRIFDSMNWMENMKLPVEEALKTGKIVEGAICYASDMMDPKETTYTLDYYCRKAAELEAMGCHCIAIKDMSSLLKPYAAKKLVEALKKEVHVPIHLHTHDTAGNGIGTYLMAAEAGVDIVDCAIGSMSSLTSQPSMNSLVEALRGTERDTQIDPEGLLVLDEYYAHERKVYKVFESGIDAPDTAIYQYGMPGGQYSNFTAQLKEMGVVNNFKEIRRLYKEADELLGNIIKVTPTSKVVGDLAIFMQRNNLTKENIFTEGRELSYPDSVVEYFEGLLGQPEGGFPEEFRRIVLKDRTPIEGRPGALLPDVDFDKIAEFLRENYYMDTMEKPEVMEQKVLSYALYPRVYEDYCEHFQAYNDVSKLESHVYFYGLRPGEETVIQIEEGNDILIKFVQMSEPDEKGYRTLQFEVNGFYRETRVLDKNFEVKADRRLKMDPRNPGHLGASMPGIISDIKIKEGDVVKKNMPLMTIEAMKMETTVTSRVSGVVDKIYVSEGDEVNQDALLVSFILDEEEMKNVTHPELPEMDLASLYEDDFKTVSIDGEIEKKE